MGNIAVPEVTGRDRVRIRNRFPRFFLSIDLFIHKNMGAAIIDFRVCLPLVKCKNLMFLGFIDAPMYGFSVLYQVVFILILYRENNGNSKKKIHTRSR
jgi:hypothetical protein